MSEKRVFWLSHPRARSSAMDAIKSAPDGYRVTICDAAREAWQNDQQWPYLRGFARQLQWPVNGVMCDLSEEEWKDILTAAYERDTEPRIAAGWDGGVVMLGRRTSRYGKRRFGEWMEWLRSAAALKGIEPVYTTRSEDGAMALAELAKTREDA